MAKTAKPDNTAGSTSGAVAPVSFEDLVKEFQAILDPEKRKAFYEANPELSRLFSPVNFH